MNTDKPNASIPEQVLDLVESVDRLYDFTNRTRGAENYLSDCMTEIIVRAGGTASREVPYLDAPSLHCDLFAEIRDERCYFENKILFPTWWLKNRGQITRDRQRLLEPLESFALPRESHSAARDLERLATHRLDCPDWLGIVVVTSHDEQFDPQPDSEKFARLARLDEPPWLSGTRRFPNTFWYHKGGYLLDARVWICPAEEMAGWWQTVKHRYQS